MKNISTARLDAHMSLNEIVREMEKLNGSNGRIHHKKSVRKRLKNVKK
jgi:hypothetical protein